MRSRLLRTELHSVFLDILQAKDRAAGNGIPLARVYQILPTVTTAAKLLAQDESLRQLNGWLLGAIEEERSRLARELHDDLNQHIAWLQLKVSSLQTGAAATPEAQEAERRLLANGLDELSAKISGISRRLHPAILRDLGLEAAIRSYVAEFADLEGVKAAFRAKDVPRGIPEAVGINVYRILQEALHNVSKHANAARVLVTLSGSQRRGLRLSVRDNGAGIKARLPKDRRGLGMISMEERARLVHGSLTVRSKQGQGTQIIVQVPLETPGETGGPESASVKDLS